MLQLEAIQAEAALDGSSGSGRPKNALAGDNNNGGGGASRTVLTFEEAAVDPSVDRWVDDVSSPSNGTGLIAAMLTTYTCVVGEERGGPWGACESGVCFVVVVVFCFGGWGWEVVLFYLGGKGGNCESKPWKLP